MNLYLLERTDNIDYDEYVSDVVAAQNETRAKEVSMVGKYPHTIELIGIAKEGTIEGCIIINDSNG